MNTRLDYPKFGALILILVLIMPLMHLATPVSAQTTIYYFDAVSGYYYIVKGNYDVFYVDSNGNRIWIQTYQWDINNSYIIFQSPISARIYLVPSSSTKSILNTQSWWLPADPDPSQLTLTINITFSSLFPAATASYNPSNYSIVNSVAYDGVSVNAFKNVTAVYNVSSTLTSRISKSSSDFDTWVSSGVQTGASYVASASGSTAYFGSIPVSITSVKGRSSVTDGWGSAGPTDAWITRAAATPGDGFCTVGSIKVYGTCYYYVSLSYSGSTVSTSSTEQFSYYISSSVSFIYLAVYYDVSISVSTVKTNIYQKTFSPDAYGRITALNNNIVVDVSKSLNTVNLGYSVNYLSMALYASTLQITLSNDTVNGFIVTLDTSGFAAKVSNINPVVYIRDLNRFYPLAIYGFNTSKTIIAVPAQLPKGSYTIDIIWNYPFTLNTWSNITSTTYNAPSDILTFLLVNGYVAVNDLYQPYHVNITGVATFTMLAGNLVEINMTYNSAYDVPIALPYIGNDTPVYIEMPLPSGSTYTATLTAYDGAVYAPHLYTWYLDGVDDYVVIPLTVYGWSGITVQEWIYPFYPKPRTDCALYNVIGDPWTDGPSLYHLAGDGSYYSNNVVISRTRNSSNIGIYYFSVRDYLNVWINIALRFSLSDRTFIGYVNGNNVYSTAIPNTEKTVLEWNPATATYPDYYKRFVLGADSYYSENMKMMQENILIYSRALSDSEISNTYTSNIINASSLVVFLDPTFYNGTHFIDLSGFNNHGIGYNGVSRVLDNRTWIYTILNSTMGSPGYMVFRFFPQGTRIRYGSYSIQISPTLNSLSIGNYSFYMPRLGDTLVGNITVYSITTYNTVYPVDPVNVSITVLNPLGINTYPIYTISLAMGIGRGSWAYKIPVYITLSELPSTPVNVFRVKLPLGIWIKQGLLSPSLEDLCIVSSDNDVLPFIVLYWESSDYAVVYVKYTKPLTGTTLTLYVYLKNTYLWGTGNSFQSLSTFDLINPSGAFAFTDPVWNYTATSTYGVYNYYVFTSWSKILIATTLFDGVILDPANGKLIEYHGTYTKTYDITPIIASRELSLIIRGSVFNVYADGNPALSVDLSNIFPANVSTTIYYVGWSGTNVYVSTTTFYTYTISGLIGGVQTAPPVQVNNKNNNVQVATPSFDWWSMMPMLFILVVLAIVMRLMSGGVTTSGSQGGVRLP